MKKNNKKKASENGVKITTSIQTDTPTVSTNGSNPGHDS